MPSRPPAETPEIAVPALPDLSARYQALMGEAMRETIGAAPGLEQFYGMMSYHLGWLDQDLRPTALSSGKSLRPSLCLLLGEALGAEASDLSALAGGLELLHNFSLIHDDIQDRSPTRRHRPTVWSLWGEAQAINAGDGMFSLAHLAWLRSPLAERSPEHFIVILRSLENTILGLCEGQFLDMLAERNLEESGEMYLLMIGRKTAGLIGESASTGARAATDAPEASDHARSFGLEFGLAFQIGDYILGIWGDEAVTGKSATSDITTRKMTLPIILALESGSPACQHDLRRCYARPPEAKDDTRVRALLEAAGARDRALAHEER